jgi:Coenzyme PQQ synthesis protein D (PqqD)
MDVVRFLQMRPVAKPGIRMELSEGQYHLTIPRTLWFARLCTRWLGRSDVTYIELDALTAFIWQKCTGKYTVVDIADAVRVRFDTVAEPVMENVTTSLKRFVYRRLVRLE